MNWTTWRLIMAGVAGGTCFILAVIASTRAKTNRAAKLFAYSSLFLGLWNVSDIVVASTKDPGMALFLDRLSYFWGFLILPAFLLLGLEVAGVGFQRKVARIICVTAGILAPLAFTPWFIESVSVTPQFIETVGPLWSVFVIGMTGSLVYGIFAVARAFPRAHGSKLSQLRYAMFSFSFALIAATTYFFSIRWPVLAPFAFLFEMVYISSLAYTVLRFRLVEVTQAFRYFVIYGLFSVTLALPLVLYAWWAQSLWIAVALIGLSIGFGLPFFRVIEDRIMGMVDRLPPFRDRSARFSHVLQAAGQFNRVTSTGELGKKLLDIVRDLFSPAALGILKRQPNEPAFLIAAGEGLTLGEASFLSLEGTSPLLAWLKSRRSFLLKADLLEESTETVSGIVAEMDFLHAELVWPLFAQEEIEAILFLTPRNVAGSPDLDVAHLGYVMRAAEHRLEVLLSGMRREQQTAVWAHDLVKPFGPKGSLKEVRALAAGGYGEIPERARAMLGRVAEEMAFVGANLKRLIHPNAEEQYNIQQTSLTGVYGRVRDRFQGLATEQGIDWRINVPPEDVRVLCDEGMIEHRVIGNLVENAFRHTPKGGVVELGYRVEAKTFTGYVKDTGPGIPPEDQEKLFQPGVQLEGVPQGEAGLGLYSVKSVLENHGGKVWVESVPGQGASFAFELPMVV